MIPLHRFAPYCVLLALLLWPAGCDDPVSPNPGEPLHLVQPSGATLVVGESLTLGVHADFDDTADPVQWTVSNPAVATIDGTGVVTALRDGQTGVRAVVGDRVARGLITVTAPSAAPVSNFLTIEHPYPPEQRPLDLFDVWGAESDDVFAVGESGTILHWDGAAWSAMAGGGEEDLRAVWGTTGDDVYAAGDRLYHYNGSRWEQVDEEPPVPVNGLAGTASDEVLAVGTATLLGYDGSRWSTLASDRWRSYDPPPMEDVWAGSAQEVFMVGNSVFSPGGDGLLFPILLRYDGQEVAQFSLWQPSDTREHWLRGVAGRDDGSVMAVGGRADESTFETRIHAVLFDGESWDFVDGEDEGDLYDVWGSATGVWFGVGRVPSRTGTAPGLLVRSNGESWERDEITDEPLHGVWGARSAAVFAVGEDGAAHHYDGSAWTRVPTPAGGGAPPMPEADLWGAAPDDVYAVGSGGGIMHYDGAAWTAQASGTEADLDGVWGASPTAVFAVGAGGTVLRTDGDAWVSLHSGGEDLRAVWGVTEDLVYAVGDGGRVLRYDGEAWRDLDVGTDADLQAIWGFAPDDILVAGIQGTLLRYDGTRWVELRGGLDETYHTIWGTTPDNIYVGGSETRDESNFRGFILHHQGAGWSRVSNINAIPYYDIWGTGPNDVFAMGGKEGSIRARILHFDGTRWSVALARPGEQEVRAGWGTADSPVHFLLVRPAELLQGARP